MEKKGIWYCRLEKRFDQNGRISEIVNKKIVLARYRLAQSRLWKKFFWSSTKSSAINWRKNKQAWKTDSLNEKYSWKKSLWFTRRNKPTQFFDDKLNR